MNFIISTILFIPWFILWLISLFIVPIMLKAKWNGKPLWDGTTTWFGNFKWGRGELHYKFPAKTLKQQWWFLCMRNPVSNFGKRVLAVKDKPWVWLHDVKIIGRFHWKYGWKTPSGEMPGIRTFVYRPWFHK